MTELFARPSYTVVDATVTGSVYTSVLTVELVITVYSSVPTADVVITDCVYCSVPTVEAVFTGSV